MQTKILFNDTMELTALSEKYAVSNPLKKSGSGGQFEKKAINYLSNIFKSKNILLTPSCTASLEISALLLDLKPQDEVIMPSNTFCSTANAVALRGATPVFVDCDDKTLNIDPEKVGNAITSKTKSIWVVNYAGSSCDLDQIVKIASDFKLSIIEDAAQSIGSEYKGNPLGLIGVASTVSFHSTKNIFCGEGGALIVNDPRYLEKAEIIREKGTNRQMFMDNKVQKYNWLELGSSYVLSENSCRTLCSQLEIFDEINLARKNAFDYYYTISEELEKSGYLRRQVVPNYCHNNGHMFFVQLADEIDRNQVIKKMRAQNIELTSHYVPLHSSPAGKRYGRCGSDMTITNKASKSLLRLPLYFGISATKQEKVIEKLRSCIV